MGESRSRLSIPVLALALTGACDAQMSPSYIGEPLLTVTGRVEISAAQRASLIIPALAFPAANGSVLIRDVQVQGQFPSDFRLDVYEPPPGAALIDITAQKSGEPRAAVGYITAVSSDHPQVLRSATASSQTRFGCREDECARPCAAPGCLVSQAMYCVVDEPSVPCFVESQYCPTFESPEEDCTTVPDGGGDPALKESPYRGFAGFSRNYVVVYLEAPAPAGSVTAARLGSRGREVPAGYGLYAMWPLTEAEVRAGEACRARAEIEAAAGFNREFGTSLTTLDFDAVCGPQAPGQVGFAAPFCGAEAGEEEKLDAAFAALERYVESAARELDCPLSLVHVERVVDPDSQPISVLIGAEVQPLSFTPP